MAAPEQTVGGAPGRQPLSGVHGVQWARVSAAELRTRLSACGDDAPRQLQLKDSEGRTAMHRAAGYTANPEVRTTPVRPA